MDLNTQYSGITEEHMKKELPTLGDVQKQFLDIVYKETILVGHSLESDLKALRISHEKVIDSSILFPHPKGPPVKYSLKLLASQYLKQSIQEYSSGHDSLEDAKAALNVVYHKVKELKEEAMIREFSVKRIGQNTQK